MWANWLACQLQYISLQRSTRFNKNLKYCTIKKTNKGFLGCMESFDELKKVVIGVFFPHLLEMLQRHFIKRHLRSGDSEFSIFV